VNIKFWTKKEEKNTFKNWVRGSQSSLLTHVYNSSHSIGWISTNKRWILKWEKSSFIQIKRSSMFCSMIVDKRARFGKRCSRTPVLIANSSEFCLVCFKRTLREADRWWACQIIYPTKFCSSVIKKLTISENHFIFWIISSNKNSTRSSSIMFEATSIKFNFWWCQLFELVF